MNIHQLKQQLQNNLWYGESRRARSANTPYLAAALIHPDYSRPWLIDISHWDGIVDLAITKALGCSGVIIKGMDGTVQSRYFVENYTKAVAVGLPRSSYAWLYRNANVSCIAQAQAFSTLLNRYPPSPELPPVIDFEATRYSGAQSNPTFDDLRKWVTEWLRLGNQKPWLYTGKYYCDQFGQMPADLRGMFAGLWIANYGVTSPGLPLSWTEWKLWQFSANGDALLIAPGNTGKLELDLNYAVGGIVPPTEPPPGGNMTYVTGTTKAANSAGGLQVRVGPSTTSESLGSLPFGTAVYGELLNGWIKGTFNGMTGYISAGWVNYTLTQPPTTPPTPNRLARLELVLAVGSTFKILDAAGNVIVEGTA